MSHDMTSAVEQQTSEQPGTGPEALRIDSNGSPVIAEWDDLKIPGADGKITDPAPSVEENADLEDQWEAEWSSSSQVRHEVQSQWDSFRRKMVDRHFTSEELLDGVEKYYSTSKAASFFGRSNQWMYWGLRNDIFQYKNGSPIRPQRVGKGGRRRFTLPIIREIALSCYRRGNVSEAELTEIMAKILIAEFGERAFAPAEVECGPL